MIELQQSFVPRPKLTHALFDFDGTISLLRAGWFEVMHALFIQCVPEVDPAVLANDISELTGKQTIYQMMKLAERVAEQGRNPEEPLEYKKEFLRRLDHVVSQRKQAIADDSKIPENFRVFGSLEMLEDLRARGIRMVLASGTDEDAVREEARLLNVDHLFDVIIGARDDAPLTCVKRRGIHQLLARIPLGTKAGEHFVVFGDGVVEIAEGKRQGGLAVGVPSIESTDSRGFRLGGAGLVDNWKYERLLKAGADIIIPDFGDHQQLVSTILNE